MSEREALGRILALTRAPLNFDSAIMFGILSSINSIARDALAPVPVASQGEGS